MGIKLMFGAVDEAVCGGTSILQVTIFGQLIYPSTSSWLGKNWKLRVLSHFVFLLSNVTLSGRHATLLLL